MYYVIYNSVTHCLFITPSGRQAVYDGERGAKGQFTKMRLSSPWKIASYEQYRLEEPMVNVKNLMSGQSVAICASDVGGCCDPSTEQYWSM